MEAGCLLLTRGILTTHFHPKLEKLDGHSTSQPRGILNSTYLLDSHIVSLKRPRALGKTGTEHKWKCSFRKKTKTRNLWSSLLSFSNQHILYSLASSRNGWFDNASSKLVLALAGMQLASIWSLGRNLGSHSLSYLDRGSYPEAQTRSTKTHLNTYNDPYIVVSEQEVVIILEYSVLINPQWGYRVFIIRDYVSDPLHYGGLSATCIVMLWHVLIHFNSHFTLSLMVNAS